MIVKVGVDSIQKVESELTKIIDSDVGRDEKFHQLFSLVATITSRRETNESK
jgi:hypothetical protein